MIVHNESKLHEVVKTEEMFRPLAEDKTKNFENVFLSSRIDVCFSGIGKLMSKWQCTYWVVQTTVLIEYV